MQSPKSGGLTSLGQDSLGESLHIEVGKCVSYGRMLLSNRLALKDLTESYCLELVDYAVVHSTKLFCLVDSLCIEEEVHLSKLKTKYWQRTDKYGIRIPKSAKGAIEIDQENHETHWQDTIKLEMENSCIAFEVYAGDTRNLIATKQEQDT